MKEMIYTELTERLFLDSGEYKGYSFWIVSYGTHPCAYVEVGKQHPYYGKCGCDAFDLPIKVHGGITYGDFGLGKELSKEHFILGWDYNHYGDDSCSLGLPGKRWTTKEIFDDVKKVIEQLIKHELYLKGKIQ